MSEVKYRLDKSGDFIIENYHKAKAFSSFFPGIAGLHGIPMWAFYVNRGQCISCFGTNNKDGAILEFMPANQAYNMTSIKGYRTFIKSGNGKERLCYEPFKDNCSESCKFITRKMTIRSYELELEEINESLGIKTEIVYITVPNESFNGLARKVTITNISKADMDLEILDGLGQIVPYGMTEWHQKHMSRTIEAWMTVLNLDKNAPFYRLKVNPQDKPELEFIERGNFYMAFQNKAGDTKQLRAIVDPDIVFGLNGDLSYPSVFAESAGPVIMSEQKSEGKTPSALSYSECGLKQGESVKIISLTGNTSSAENVNKILKLFMGQADYFNRKVEENRDIINRLENNIFTKSSSDEFDFYARQTYLDNLLRGGIPISIETPAGPFVYYAYARKHGDMERDYNAFKLEPSYYSQGNGAYRDINQNRRNDVLFNSDVGDMNIKTFLNAIQPDGFNPHLIEGIRLFAVKGKSLNKILNKYLKSAKAKKRVREFMGSKFTPGAFLFFLEDEKILNKKDSDRLLKEILAISKSEDVISPGEGYWVDHWTYNIDLFDNYLACYPERLKELLIADKRFTYYDTYLKVMPRSEKYVYVDGKKRQFASVLEDEDKKNFINSRKSERHKVRTEHGKGRIYRTSLLVKLVSILINKMASLDAFGIGIEMEAGKPGWCDSLNGLPGIFGSSLCEVFEIKRMIYFIISSLKRIGIADEHEFHMPCEVYDFLTDLDTLVRHNLNSKSGNRDFEYWDRSWTRKERYRNDVWYGFDGREKSISSKTLVEILKVFLQKIDKGLDKGYSSKNKMTYSYYINEVKGFNFIKKNGKNKLNKDGLPCVKASSFNHRPVSLFLEGPVHAMKVMNRVEAASLYKAVRRSEIFDKLLKMYKVNEPLKDMPLDIGRSTIFAPGWLENESVWLHMEYKYLLEVLKAGLYEEFFDNLKDCLVAFQNPYQYGRSILENSSFIISSAYPYKDLHGNGFVARLTGTTTEFLSMWLLICLGQNPFVINSAGELQFKPSPKIPGWLFTKETGNSQFYLKDGSKISVDFKADIFAFSLLGSTLVVYSNPKRRSTFGSYGVKPVGMILRKNGLKDVVLKDDVAPLPYAEKIRSGLYDRIDIELA